MKQAEKHRSPERYSTSAVEMEGDYSTKKI